MKFSSSYLIYVGLLMLGFCVHSCSNDFEPELKQNRSVKRGVSYSFQIPDDDAKLLSPGVSWFYNWDSGLNDVINAAVTNHDIEYFPMAWNTNFNREQLRAYKLTHPSCNYILAYNEPNLLDQANMTPQQAAEHWPTLKSIATELNMKIISPAMNYGTLTNYGDPIVWLDEFFTLIPITDIDGIAVHCYMSNAFAMVSYLNRFKKYDKPIWLTEFCAWENSIRSVDDQMKYMCDAVNYLEASNMVFRYAWFIPRANTAVDVYPFMQLLSKTTPYELTPLGKVFVNMSSQDKTVFSPESQQIPAENYSSLNTAETAKNDAYSNSVRLRPTTDSEGELEIFDFYKGYWVEYQMNISNKYDHKITFRYSALAASAMEIYIDNELSATCNFPATATETAWSTISTSLNPTVGKHTIILKISAGSICLNWLSINKK